MQIALHYNRLNTLLEEYLFVHKLAIYRLYIGSESLSTLRNASDTPICMCYQSSSI